MISESHVKHLERDCENRWKELLLDILCFLCGNTSVEDEIRLRPTCTSTTRYAGSPSLSTHTHNDEYCGALTALCYYQRWPGFCNEKCYSIFEDFSNNPEKYISQEMVEEGVEELKEHKPVSMHEPNKYL